MPCSAVFPIPADVALVFSDDCLHLFIIYDTLILVLLIGVIVTIHVMRYFVNSFVYTIKI